MPWLVIEEGKVAEALKAGSMVAFGGFVETQAQRPGIKPAPGYAYLQDCYSDNRPAHITEAPGAGGWFQLINYHAQKVETVRAIPGKPATFYVFRSNFR